MKKLLLFLIPILYGLAYGGEQIQIEFEYPSITGDFYVAGTVFFPPAAAPDLKKILVMDKDTREEIPSKIVVQDNWPDGSVLSAEIVFPANSQKKGKYIIFYGDDVERKKSFVEAAVLPTVSFIVPGAGTTVENMDVSVGQINVRVDRSTNIRYWWYILPVFFLILLTVLRTLRTIRMQKL
ncbi:MAG: hypothetical protein NC937_01100 [Candidatus Omnitrophica bacterium]|nr:hypothetical protein [Candidatus Omnitrophota bacterium]MCM8824739.1 hypothetical protein [Candidatus Omnitrophota bacterium]